MIVPYQCLVLVQCQFLTLLVFFLALRDFHPERIDLILELRLESEMLGDFFFEPHLQILDLLLLKSHFGIH